MARKISLKGAGLKSKPPKTYLEYLDIREEGYEDEYAQGILNAKRTKERSLPTYGSEAESLGRAGLSQSGYSDYLNDLAESNYEKQRSALSELRAEAAREAKRDYESYLASYSEEAEKTRKSMVDSMIESGAKPSDDLYSLAQRLGLSKRLADSAAREARATVTEQIIEELLPELITSYPGEEKVRSIGKEKGLDQDGIRLLEKRLREHYSTYSGYQSSYKEYLEKIGALTPYTTQKKS